MNSLLKFVFLCVSVILLGTSVQSRSLQRFALKRENEGNPLCQLVIMIMDEVVKHADLNLTPEQKALLPHQSLSTRSEGGECDKERDEWMKSMTPFLMSLSEEQQGKFVAALNKLSANSGQTQRAVSVAQGMIRRAITNQQKSYNDDDDE